MRECKARATRTRSGDLLGHWQHRDQRDLGLFWHLDVAPLRRCVQLALLQLNDEAPEFRPWLATGSRPATVGCRKSGLHSSTVQRVRLHTDEAVLS